MLGENAQRPGRWPPFNKGFFAWCVRNGVNWFVVNGWRVICVGSVVCVRRGLLLERGQIGKAQGGARGDF